jgi:hypothetical protein
MSKVTLICLCVLISAWTVILRIQKLEEALAKAAYAACSSKDTSPLKLIKDERF